MKLIYAGLYPKNGVAVYRYNVVGTATEIADYVSKQSQVVYQENTQVPLFFSHKPLGCECDLRLSRDGQQWFPKDDELLMTTSTAKSMGTAGDMFLAMFMSQRIAAMIQYLKRKPKAVQEQPQVPEEQPEEQPLDDL